MLNQKGLAPIFMILGVVILIGLVGGVVYYQSLPHELASNPDPMQEIQEVKEEIQLDEDFQESSETDASVNISTSSAEGLGTWKNYEDNLIKFSYPEGKSFSSSSDTNNEPTRFFYFSGKESQYSKNRVAMYIRKEATTDVRENSEASDKVYKGDISPKAMAEKSRNYSLGVPSSENKTTTEIKEITVDGKSGYYYDFQGSYYYPLGGGGIGAFLTEDGCKGRAIFVNSNKGVYNIVYCMRPPFEDIYKSIELK